MNVNDVIAQNVRAARERKKLTLDGGGGAHRGVPEHAGPD